jgi:2,3-bisphosphoglycerate-independent phosphoglycerate mutase
VIGRYYAMDRDKRWERIKIAIDGLVQGEGEKVERGKEGLVEAIEENYKKNVTDEFLKPIIVNGDEGRIKGVLSSILNAAPTKCHMQFFV